MTVNYGLITYYDKWLKKGKGHTYFKKQGEEKEFYESGILMRTVNYIDGEKEGEEKLFYKNGVLKESKTWWGRDMGYIYGWKSRKYGEERIFYESGQLKKLIIHAKKTKLPESGSFEYGLEPNWPHNYCTKGNAKEEEKVFFESEKLKSIENYFEGKKSGERKSFRENGQINTVSNYLKGEKSGEEIWFYETDHSDESPRIYGTFQWSESKRNGEAKRFYKSGVLKDSSTFVNGFRKGEKIFYESGALKYLAYFDGKQEGEAKVFYESGALKVIIPEEDGEGKIFYETGELESIINLKAGFPTNNVGYYKSGELKWEQSYERNYSSGSGGGWWHSLKTYDKLGELDDSIQLDPTYLENNWYNLFTFRLVYPS